MPEYRCSRAGAMGVTDRGEGQAATGEGPLDVNVEVAVTPSPDEPRIRTCR